MMKLTITTLLALLCAIGSYAQTYASLPFSDNLSSGSLGASWTFNGNTTGANAVTDLSGGWPNFGTCNVATCPGVGATSGNGLIIYNSSAPSGTNRSDLDLHLNLSGMGTVDLSYAVVDWRSGYDSLTIFLSNNGGSSFTRATTVKLWLAPHTDGIWNEVSHDITALAAATGVSFNSTYVVRFATYLQHIGSSSSPKSWPNQSVYYDNFVGTETAALPVELLYLKGENTTNGNHIQWATGAEVNNEKFEIHRSFDGISWLKIGEVQGQGNTESATQYSYTDPINEKAYYRLKQVDFDGKFNHSNNVLIGNNGQELSLQVNNNGSNPEIGISGIIGQSTIEAYSLTGQLIYSETKSDENGFIKSQLNFLSNGSYLIVVKANGKAITKKVSVLK